jgi:hypothetical protein
MSFTLLSILLEALPWFIAALAVQLLQTVPIAA